MAVNLSETQAEQVDANRLQVRPSYYDAGSQSEVEISQDFEAFLILAPSLLKTSAIEWIQQAQQIQTVNQNRDTLKNLGLAQELSNAQAKLTAYQDVLGDFNAFRTNFQTTTQFAGVPEVQQFLSDLQAVIDELVCGQDRAFFDQTACQVISLEDDDTDIAEQQIEELQSWTGVLSAYLTG